MLGDVRERHLLRLGHGCCGLEGGRATGQKRQCLRNGEDVVRILEDSKLEWINRGSEWELKASFCFGVTRIWETDGFCCD